jgi:lipoprotein signal peptidase
VWNITEPLSGRAYGRRMTTTIALAGGSWIFLAGVIFFIVGNVVALYTRTGSGINQHAYGKIYSGAPGASIDSSISGHDGREHNWSRGTR